MRFTLLAGILKLQGGPIALGAIIPWVDGAGLASGNWRVGATGNNCGNFIWEMLSGEKFILYWESTDEGLEVEFGWTPGGTNIKLSRLGIHVGHVGPLAAYFRNGYFSWDGSYYITPGSDPAGDTVTGYAVTQLLAKPSGAGAPQNLVLGFDRHETFQHEFVFAPSGAALTIETLWDERAGLAAELRSERLLVFASSGVEAGLRKWAQIIAARGTSRPRLAAPQVRGWCSWYNLYAAITEENILEHLRATRAAVDAYSLPMEYFQIDDGFTPEMGDWLEVKPQFPRGMKALLQEIKAAGFKPGLWIAPFMVGNRSHLFRDHPEWVVREKKTGAPLAQMKFYAEFRWHKRSEEYYILDCTHPAALAYIKEVFRVWREEWGCEYFKTDFMHFGSAHGPETAVWHQPGLARMEIWRRLATTIREAIGEAFWLGCGCPLWASVGLVDGVRIGRDIGVEWKGNYSAQSLLRDQATRNFGHRVLWQADPDCILLRNKFHFLTDTELRSLAYYAGMAGGVTMTSDNLGELTPDRLALWKEILSLGDKVCRYPTLGRIEAKLVDPVLVQLKNEETEEPMIYVFNTTDLPVIRCYNFAELGVGSLYSGQRQSKISKGIDYLRTVEVRLDPHEGKVLQLGP